MKTKGIYKSLLEIHIATFLFGLTGLFSKEVFYGALTLLGIIFVLPLTEPDKAVLLGGAVGIVSGGIYAYYTIKNVELVRNYSGMKVAFYEHVVSSLVLLLAVFYLKPTVTGRDIVLLILLGTVFTGIGHSLFINGLKNVDAYLASIIIMLEPIYAIVLAWVLLGEIISIRVGIGAAIILFTVYMVSKDKIMR